MNHPGHRLPHATSLVGVAGATPGRGGDAAAVAALLGDLGFREEMHRDARVAVAGGMPRADLLAANLDAARRFVAIAGFDEPTAWAYVARLTLATVLWVEEPLAEEN
jgi:hypothetical protein